MNTLRTELEEILLEIDPPLIDLAQLERLATEDELQVFEGECSLHDGCRPVLDRRLN